MAARRDTIGGDQPGASAPGVGPSPEVAMAVTKVVSDYALTYDAGDFERFSRLWAEGATFTTVPDLGVLPIPMVGRTVIVAELETLWHKNVGIAVRHYTTNVSVEIAVDGQVVAASGHARCVRLGPSRDTRRPSQRPLRRRLRRGGRALAVRQQAPHLRHRQGGARLLMRCSERSISYPVIPLSMSAPRNCRDRRADSRIARDAHRCGTRLRTSPCAISRSGRRGR